MKIIAVRHTSVDVPSGYCYGQKDVDIASTFESEKNQIALSLLDENFGAVYSSPLLRCRKLAESVCNSVKVIYDPRLMEMNFGEWEGNNWDEISKTATAGLWFRDWLKTPCPKGESYQQLITRVNGFLLEIIPADSNILIVTHSGVIRAMEYILNGIEPRKTFEMKIDFGSITIFRTDK